LEQWRKIDGSTLLFLGKVKEMEVADKQHTSSKTMQEFHANFT